MARTAEAANWSPYEDKLMYDIITAFENHIPMSERYERVSEYFDAMNLTAREPNAIRQRWNKIKDLDFSEDVPVTTGVQQELDFDDFLQDLPVQVIHNHPEVSFIYPEREEAADEFDLAIQSIQNFRMQQLDLISENHDLKNKLADANIEINRLKEELATFQKVKALLSVSS